MDIQLGSGGRYTLSKPVPTPGAIYQGLVVGVSGPGGVIRPISAHWPDARGRFSLLLPASARGVPCDSGRTSTSSCRASPAVPGGRIDLTSWPRALGETVPRGFALIRTPTG